MSDAGWILVGVLQATAALALQQQRTGLQPPCSDARLDAACSPGAHLRATKQPHILLLALFLCLYIWVLTRRVHRQGR